MYAWIVFVLCVPTQDHKFQVTQGFVVEVHPAVSPSRLPKFIDVPVKYNRMNDGSLLADILNRTDEPSLGDGRATDGHESTHRLNNQLRNARGGSADCCFYMFNGKAGYCREPGGFRKSQVAQYVPNSLRESRFRTYVQGAGDWDDKPSYIAEEWSAYINDAAINVEDHGKGFKTDQVDCATGALEMGIYTIALCMAVEKYAPESWADDAQFKAIMKHQWVRAKEVYDKAAPLWPFHTQDELLKSLRTSPDAEAMRQFIKTHFDGVWLTP